MDRLIAKNKKDQYIIMNRVARGNIGGFYPMNQYRFVPNRQAPIIPAEAPLPVKLCSGTPIAALHTALPPEVNATFVPNVPLTKDERELRQFMVEAEREAKAKKREQEFIYELQGRVNTDARQKDDYKNLIEREITEIAGSNRSMADKVLRIQELMTSADRMGLNPQVASPMLLEALERFGMAAGFGGIVDQLQQNQAIAERAPQQPILSSASGFDIGSMGDEAVGNSLMSGLPSEVGRSMAWDTIEGGSSAAYSDFPTHQDPADYYATIAAQAQARPVRTTPPRPSGGGGIAAGGEYDGGGGVSYQGTDSDIRGYREAQAELQAAGMEGQWVGAPSSVPSSSVAVEEAGAGAGAVPKDPFATSRSSRSDLNPAEMLQHGSVGEGDDDFGAMLRRMRRRPARPADL